MSAYGGSPEGLDIAALHRFFEGAVNGTAGPLHAELLHGGRSNLTYRVTDGRSTWVVRRPPLGGLTPSAHDIGREFRVAAALWGSGVPVARTVALCEDASVIGTPFSVVEHVPGQVVRTQAELERLSPAETLRCGHALIDVLARLHAVPHRAVGLGDFGRPAGYLFRQVRRWCDQWERVSTRPVADVETLHARLAAGVPAESGASIVHGDYRIDNAILDPAEPSEVRALVDWEMATVGDPLADLALHLVYRDPAFDPVLGGSAASTSHRLPHVRDLAEHYARVTGRDLTRLGFYLGLGYFKIAVIAEGIHARHRQGLTLGDGFETVGQAVPLLAAAGLRALKGKEALL
ncbi:phosphotransferase family protein [Streptomyces carpinensis]|uniref:Phosphotransferase family protein n=1 Tax=Streptomyces carpinensis TaxID=66369 RepID=A0ABV1W1B6_9ACTN|nr:phosphotransferase family protein [Streptomyces carpinensis]